MSETSILAEAKIDSKERLHHFAAGMLKWLLNNSQENHNWKSDFEQFCPNLVEESLNLEKLPSETDQKTQALIQSVPGIALFWLGIFTGTFWLLPGVAMGVYSSFVIAKCVNQVFSSGKEARFFRTLIYYLLRMENADGIISSAELNNLRSIIEFIPASMEEKELWQKAMQTSDGYKQLAPEGHPDRDEKEKILSACWSLAICDGLAQSEKETFNRIADELEVSKADRQRVIEKVDKLFTEHSQSIWQAIKIARILNLRLSEDSQTLYRIVSMVSVKPVDENEFLEKLNGAEAMESRLPFATKVDPGKVLLSAYILARIVNFNVEENSNIAEEAAKLFEKFATTDLSSHLQWINDAISRLQPGS